MSMVDLIKRADTFIKFMFYIENQSKIPSKCHTLTAPISTHMA